MTPLLAWARRLEGPILSTCRKSKRMLQARFMQGSPCLTRWRDRWPKHQNERVRSRARLQGRRKFGGLPDRTLRIELRRDVGATDHMHGDAQLDQFAGQRTVGLLSGADDNVVDAECLRLAVDADVQTGIVDPFVRDAAEHLDALGFQRRAMYPAGGLVEALARPACRALQQPDFTR